MSVHGDIFAAPRSIFDGATRFIVELHSFAFISIRLRSKHSYLRIFDIGFGASQAPYALGASTASVRCVIHVQVGCHAVMPRPATCHP